MFFNFWICNTEFVQTFTNLKNFDINGIKSKKNYIIILLNIMIIYPPNYQLFYTFKYINTQCNVVFNFTIN